MRHLLPVFLAVMVLGIWNAGAQGILIQENFESYTPGSHLCAQAPAWWTTWNEGPGTAEDPVISDSIAWDGTRSLPVRGTNDALLRFQERTTGRYRVSFFMFVPSNHTGYYGMLRHFNGPSSDWGLQCYFSGQGQGTLVSGDPGITGNFTYSYNQWFNVTNIVDLDNDHAEIYVDSTLVAEFPWSASRRGMPINRGPALDALDLFAWTANQESPGAFFDAILFEELSPLPPPRNLQATVEGDTVNLSWEAPDTTGQTGYMIYRDSTILAGPVPGLEYSDLNVYPGSYTYSVKTVYTSGMSPESGPVEVNVEGGTPREFVLVEIATGTWCTYCPGAAMGADDLVANGKQAAIIEYHASDPYENTAAVARNSYYQVPGYPTTQFDGGLTIAGGNARNSMYPEFLPRYETRESKRSLFGLEVDLAQPANRLLNVTVTATRVYPYENDHIRLRLALTESHIPQHWQDIMEEVNYVCRAMYPDAAGILLDFGAGTSVTRQYEIVLDSAWSVSDCELVVFLQDDQGREVLQCTKVDINALGLVNQVSNGVSVWPNPAVDKLRIHSEPVIKQLILCDLYGVALYSMGLTGTDLTIPLEGFSPGLYLVKVETEKGWVFRKVIISK